MQALELAAGRDRYAIDALAVVEVVPSVPLRVVPGAPAFLAGLLSYRGAVVPVVDLCRMLGDAPSANRMSSRIAVCALDDERLVGLLAEDVVRLLELDPDADVAVDGPATPSVPALGKIVPVGDGLVQLVRVGELVSDDVYDELTRGNPGDEPA